jgi:hypothetical protein
MNPGTPRPMSLALSGPIKLAHDTQARHPGSMRRSALDHWPVTVIAAQTAVRLALDVSGFRRVR